ncbi:TIGR04351 family putative TOMM peptide [Sphaerimonospora thailandensis]|uniref:Uncharacterized protein n=1 Tax=Sphaerimonospora thailandensis TaxID=795644 RepID=A0A8J3RF06_9ACTN|nr:TIGR04351 family putative TOMM peptide [Sphaerimonospora thailandensis]GIH72519.1 hypothetical protein Mth01_47720 [Sphaerimonospora thailandensis]
MTVDTIGRDTIGWDTAQRRKFGELTARAWSDAGLRIRYEREPASILAEYGLTLAEGVRAPALPSEPVTELVIEALDGEVTAAVPPCLLSFCFCMDQNPPEASLR